MRKQSGYGFSTSRIKHFESEITSPENYRSGQSSDHYHRYREDFDLAKSLGHNAFRFSIEWSRVEPEPGVWDEREINHYAEVIRELKIRGIEPVITLWHWTLPIWFSQRGGFETQDSTGLFARYVKHIVERLGTNVKYWITINEPTVYAGSAYYLGIFPPEIRNIFRYWKVLRNLIRAHNLAAAAIKVTLPEARVGLAHSYVLFQAAGTDPITKLVVQIADYVWNDYLLKRTINTCDFLGANHYFSLRYHLWKQVKIDAPMSDLGWTMLPETLYQSVIKLQKYHKPILITEHGCADANDEYRGQFITESLCWLEKSIDAGCDVRGYLHWSLLDNFEWDKGFWPRFGLVAIDYKTMRLTVRPRAFVYKKLIQKYS